MNAAPEPSATAFWSIERAVAFVVGPAVTAGAGWLSAFLAKKWGITIDGPALAGIFGTGALSAAALVYKWLHGRQLEMTLKNNVLVQEIIHSPGEGFITTTLHDLEGLAESAATRVAMRITGGTSPPSASTAAASSAAVGAAPGQ